MHKSGLWIALGAALLGAGALELYMREFEARMTGGARTDVLLTTRDLRPGDVVERSALTTRPLPADYLESRHIRAHDIEKIVGMRVAESVAATEALLWSDVLRFADRQRTLARLVQEGKRAMSIAMPRASFGGLLRPGDRVDVLHVAPSSQPGTSGAGAVRTILTNLMVLAVDDDLGGTNTDATRRRDGLITLSVNADEGRTLAAADVAGNLRLLLRNPEDVSGMSSAGTEVRE
jgi:pilus assembly protein CpaB